MNSAAVLHPKVLCLLTLSIQVWFRSNGIILNTSVSTSIKEQGVESGKGLLGDVGGRGAPLLTGKPILRLGYGSPIVLPDASLTFQQIN